MKLLLDTHVWIWAFEGAEALGPKAALRITTAGAERFVSPISTLEIARLVWGQDMRLTCPTRDWIAQSTTDLRLDTLPVTHAVSLEAYQLPGEFHRDPADRILVATARVHGCHLLTADERILAYPHVETINARH